MARLQLSDEQIDGLIKSHPEGEITFLETPKGTAAFRLPTREEWLEYLKRAQGKESKGAARWITAKCVLVPDEATYHEWANTRSGIPDAAEKKLAELIGLDDTARAKDDDEGDTTTVATIAGPVTVKCPDERQLNEYKSRLGKDAQDAFEYLAQCCAVIPPRAEQRVLLDRLPGIAGTLARHIHRLSGLAEYERGKG